MKLTTWFTCNIKPMRTGVYEVKCRPGDYWGDQAFYAYWNGKVWGSAQWTPAGAYTMRYTKNSLQSRIWRGVSK